MFGLVAFAKFLRRFQWESQFLLSNFSCFVLEIKIERSCCLLFGGHSSFSSSKRRRNRIVSRERERASSCFFG